MRRLLPLLVASGLVLGACGTDGTPEVAQPTTSPLPAGSPSPAPEPSPSPSPATETSPAPSPSPSPLGGSPVDAFLTADQTRVEVAQDVFVVGASPDGSNLLVFAEDEEGFRCEESVPTSLQLLSVTDGSLRPAVADPDLPVDLLEPRTDGTYLSSAGCEGFIGSVTVVDVAPDGSVTTIEPVELGALDVLGLSGVAAVPERDEVVLVRWVEAGTELLRVDLDGTLLEPPLPLAEEHYQLWATTTGTYGIDYGQGFEPTVVELLSGRRFPGYQAVTVAPDGVALVLTGDAGVAVLRGDGSVERWVDDPVGDDVLWDGAAVVADDRIAVVADVFEAARLVLVGPDGEVGELARDVSSFPPVQVVADGTRLVFTTFDAVDFTADVVVVDRP